MKTLLMALSLALASASVHAEKWMEVTNKSGGKMILTTTQCKDKPALRVMMSTAPNKPTLFGCWAYIAGQVHVVYDDGDRYTYDADSFTLVDTDEPKPQQKGKYGY